MSRVIGVDVGGTHVRGAVVDDNGSVLVRHRHDSLPSLEALEAALEATVHALRPHGQSPRVGIAFAGFLDSERERVRFTPNLGLRDVPLRARLVERLGMPVLLENDANAAAWGEHRFGAAVREDDFVMVTVGTGIGGGIILGGRLLRGAHGMGGEIGHMRLVPDGIPCGCGARGCLEQYASGSALVRRARERLADGVPGSADLLERVGGKPSALVGETITQAAVDGDEFAAAQIAEVGRYLGEGLASLIAALDLPIVVLGGGVAAAGEVLLETTREALGEHLLAAAYRAPVDVRLGLLGGDAGLIGAAELARESLASAHL